MSEMHDTRHAEAVHFAIPHHAADGEAREVDAMIAALATDQTEALSFTADAVVEDRDFQSCLNSFRSGIREEDVVETARRQRLYPARQFEGRWMAMLEGRRV